MALLKVDVDFNFSPIKRLLVLFPELNGRFLALVGARARKLLKQKYLSGQEIDLKAFPKDKLGRFTVTSDVNKRRTSTKIYSYPVNLFEKGRRLRSGSKEAGKFIVTRKLKQDVAARIGGYGREFENGILEPAIKRVGL